MLFHLLDCCRTINQSKTTHATIIGSYTFSTVLSSSTGLQKLMRDDHNLDLSEVTIWICRNMLTGLQRLIRGDHNLDMLEDVGGVAEIDTR